MLCIQQVINLYVIYLIKNIIIGYYNLGFNQMCNESNKELGVMSKLSPKM